MLDDQGGVPPWSFFTIPMTGKEIRHDSVVSWITGEPNSGLGSTVHQLHELLKNAPDQETALLAIQRLKKQLEQEEFDLNGERLKLDMERAPDNAKDGPGRPPGNADNVSIMKETGHGNSKAYLAAVLKRDHPDIAAAVEQGKYRSIRAAALEAGIVKKTLTVPNDPERAARSIVKNFGQEFAEELARYLTKK